MALSFEVTKDSAQQFAQKAFKTHVVEKKAKAKYREAEKNATTGKSCYRCGGKSHNPNDCRFKESECHECKKKGHIAKACRTRKEGGRSSTTKGTMHLDVKRQPSALKQRSRQDVSALQRQDVYSWPDQQYPPEGASQHADPGNRHEFKGDPDETQLLSHQVREDRAASDVVVQCKMEAAPNSDTVSDLTLDSEDFGLFEMNTGNGDIVKPYYVYVSVNGSRVKMELDTGAAVSVISENLYKRRFKSVKLSPANCVLKTYSQESLQLMGKFVAKVKCQETT
ncbi:uncharacterized protein LOC106512667, partial [Austrofundulus limnaeus]|uniref:Uncharacterized protein LOC106512667 n=1 Tax=Austrofundulus limnaeus TaxID=52670 RepID=A0A2I4AMM0_AUSLI